MSKNTYIHCYKYLCIKYVSCFNELIGKLYKSVLHEPKIALLVMAIKVLFLA